MNLPRRAVPLAAVFLAVVFSAAAWRPLAAQNRAAPAARTLPADMLGSWAREQAECVDVESEGRLHVTAKTLEFFDSKLTFSRIDSRSDGWWRVEGLSRETGKRGARHVSLELRLKAAGVLSLRNGPGKPEEFVRCQPAQLQG